MLLYDHVARCGLSSPSSVRYGRRFSPARIYSSGGDRRYACFAIISLRRRTRGDDAGSALLNGAPRARRVRARGDVTRRIAVTTPLPCKRRATLYAAHYTLLGITSRAPLPLPTTSSFRAAHETTPPRHCVSIENARQHTIAPHHATTTPTTKHYALRSGRGAHRCRL